MLRLKSDLDTAFVMSRNFDESAYDRHFRDATLSAIAGDTVYLTSHDPDALAEGVAKFGSRLTATFKSVTGKELKFKVASQSPCVSRLEIARP